MRRHGDEDGSNWCGEQGIIRFIAIGCILAIAFAAGWLLSRCPATDHSKGRFGWRDPLSVAEVDLLVAENADYLSAALDNDGRFDYSYLPAEDRSESGYNILRHSGTVYAMVESYRLRPHQGLRSAIERAIGYLERSTIPVSGISGLSIPGLGEPPVGRVVEEDGEAKLGGNGLAVLALAAYTDVFKDRRYLPLARELAIGMKPFQDQSGEFRSKYMLLEARWSDFVSEYYPGEAIFGLMRLFAVDSDQEWLDMARRAASFLIHVRDGGKAAGRLPHDHWLLYGLNELHKVDPREEYLEHSLKLVEGILSIQDRGVGDPRFEGSYGRSRGFTPGATRNEGLCAAQALLGRSQHPKRADVWAALERGLKFQRAAHIGNGEAEQYPNPGRARGGVIESLSILRVRIDYVQHSMSGFICWRLA